MHVCLPAIFLIQKNKWKWLLMQWTPPWYHSAWPSARRWPARARTSALSSTSTLHFLSPWIPRREQRKQLWERSGQALPLRGEMQEEEKSSWERSLTFPLCHLLLRILQQISLPVQLLWQLLWWQLKMQLPRLLLPPLPLKKLLLWLLHHLSKGLRLQVKLFKRNSHAFFVRILSTWRQIMSSTQDISTKLTPFKSQCSELSVSEQSLDCKKRDVSQFCEAMYSIV